MTRRLTLREDYFSVLSAENGYDFGFLLADGTMDRGKNSVRIELAGYERDALEGMRARLGSTAYIATRHRIIVKKPRTQVSVGFSSRRLCADLVRLGLGPNKDFQDYTLPSVPPEAAAAVVRGLFDGDGSAVRVLTRRPTGVKLVIYGRESTLVWTAGIVRAALGIEGMIYEAHTRKQFAYTVIRHVDVVRLASWMYADGGPCLERKRIKIASLIEEREKHLATKVASRRSFDAEVASRYATGAETGAIATELGVSESRILTSVRRQGLHHRKPYARVDLSLLRLVQRRRSEGTSFPAIAQEYGLSLETARKLVTDVAYIAGLERKAARDAEIVRLRGTGLMLREIAMRIGVSKNAVAQALRRPAHQAVTSLSVGIASS